jgi:hypothetical protein
VNLVIRYSALVAVPNATMSSAGLLGARRQQVSPFRESEFRGLEGYKSETDRACLESKSRSRCVRAGPGTRTSEGLGP